MLCSVCKKNTAVIFIKKPTPEDKNHMEGICYSCAKKLGINPMDILAKQANLSEEELNDLSSQFENIFNDLAENVNIEDFSENIDNRRRND